jgi:hypothetical protein
MIKMVQETAGLTITPQRDGTKAFTCQFAKPILSLGNGITVPRDQRRARYPGGDPSRSGDAWVCS